jgi:hypothetical protein
VDSSQSSSAEGVAASNAVNMDYVRTVHSSSPNAEKNEITHSFVHLSSVFRTSTHTGHILAQPLFYPNYALIDVTNRVK